MCVCVCVWSYTHEDERARARAHPREGLNFPMASVPPAKGPVVGTVTMETRTEKALLYMYVRNACARVLRAVRPVRNAVSPPHTRRARYIVCVRVYTARRPFDFCR